MASSYLPRRVLQRTRTVRPTLSASVRGSKTGRAEAILIDWLHKRDWRQEVLFRFKTNVVKNANCNLIRKACTCWNNPEIILPLINNAENWESKFRVDANVNTVMNRTFQYFFLPSFQSTFYFDLDNLNKSLQTAGESCSQKHEHKQKDLRYKADVIRCNTCFIPVILRCLHGNLCHINIPLTLWKLPMGQSTQNDYRNLSIQNRIKLQNKHFC